MPFARFSCALFLVAFLGPAGAETLRQPGDGGAIGLVMQDLARSAPRLLAATVALPRHAEAQAEFFDLPEPDLLEWQEDALPPDDISGWHLALTGQAITASNMNRVEDWLVLSRLARQMAGHWQEGDVARTTAPLAREALLEIAVAAALRAGIAARDRAELVPALLQSAEISAEAGDRDSAFRLLHATSRLPDMAGEAELQTALADLGAAGRASPADPAPARSERAGSERVGEWSLVCANDLHCSASLATPAFLLRLSRPAGPGAALQIVFVLAGHDPTGSPWPQRLADTPPFAPSARLLIGTVGLEGTEAHDLPLRSHDDLYDGWPFHVVAPLALDPVLAALLAEPTLTVGFGRAGPEMRVPLAGLAEVLARMDRVQGRAGSVTALLLRGAAGQQAVPPAPLLPLLQVPVEVDPGRALASRADAEVLALWHKLCPQARDAMPLAPVNTHTADGTDIWLLPCAETADQGPSFTALYGRAGQVGALLDGFDLRQGRPPRPLHLRFPILGPWQDGTENWSGPARPLALTASAGPDCPGTRVWLWTGRDFQLARQSATPDCAASYLPPELYRSHVEMDQP